MSRISHGTEILISDAEVSLIDFGADYQAVRAAEGNRGSSLNYHAKQPEISFDPSSAKPITYTIRVMLS